MILLDTNVVSEIMKAVPAPQVMAWFKRQRAASVYLPAVVLGELHLGLEILGTGKRKELISAALRAVETDLFRNRIIAFEAQAAAVFGLLVAERRRRGRPLLTIDGQIAATAVVQRAPLATRDVGDFVHCGIELINPWEAEH